MSEPVAQSFVANNLIKSLDEFPDPASPEDIVVYEVIRIIDGKVLFLEDHLQRFFESFQILKKKNPLKKEEIISSLKILVRSNAVLSGNIRFEVVMKGQQNTFNFYAYYVPHSYPTKEQYENGIQVTMTTAARVTPGAKVQQAALREGLNRLMQNEKVYEVIMVHPDGYITEGSRSNLFMIRNNEIFTSSDNDVLPGITRKYVLKACQMLHFPVLFKRFTPEELLSMESIFITGTSPKVLPVSSLFNKIFDTHHPLLRSVMLKFDEISINSLKKSVNFWDE